MKNKIVRKESGNQKRKISFTVNRNMARAIKKTHRTQIETAERAGFSRAVFSNILRCKRKVYADEVCQIAEALGVSIEYLFAAEPEDRGA